jgi:hypothetical protein
VGEKLLFQREIDEILAQTTCFYTESGALLRTPFFDRSGGVESGLNSLYGFSSAFNGN